MLCGTFKKRSRHPGDEYRLVRSNTMPRIVSSPRDVSVMSVRRTKSTRIAARPLLIKDQLHTGLENVSSATLRPFNSDINTPRIDSYRFSMANLEDSQDVDLDAILGELCALERRCDGDIAATPAPDSQRPGRPTSARINPSDNTDIKNEGGIRTDSPDNDSAFSDTVSMLSSESSASSSGSGHKPPPCTQLLSSNHTFCSATQRSNCEKNFPAPRYVPPLRVPTLQLSFFLPPAPHIFSPSRKLDAGNASFVSGSIILVTIAII